ncbi:MAG: hypothetical protein AAB223_08895, partial [Pseudomonadota bacterium]
MGELLLPGVSGYDLLQAIDRRLEADGENLTLVLDNGHRLPPSDLFSDQSPPTIQNPLPSSIMAAFLAVAAGRIVP